MLLVKEKVSCLQLATLLFSIIYTTNDLKTFITSKTQTTHNVAINVMPEGWGGHEIGGDFDKKQNGISIGSSHKTVNRQGYSELREPIKMPENCYSLIW